MKFTMTKIAAALALSMMATGAHAVAVTGMTLDDTLTLAGVLGTDGYEGAFRFVGLTSQSQTGASLFKGDNNGGVIDVTQANLAYTFDPVNAFSTGFIFANSPFRPNTTGAINIDITSPTTFNVISLPWGGYFEGAAQQFNMPPDAQPTNKILIQTSANSYAYRMKFNHVITTADDPSLQYTGQNAFWIIEGTMTTAAIPEPSTYGMMAAGLGLVGAAVRRRRNRV